MTEDAGSFTFTVTLNPSSLQNVTVDYVTTGGTATSGVELHVGQRDSHLLSLATPPRT